MDSLVVVNRITVQPDKYKPLNLAPVELEVLRLKRAIVQMSVKSIDISRFQGVLEYRGKVMLIKRKEGRFHSAKLAEILEIDFDGMYGKEGLNIRAEKENGSMCECHIFDPEAFLGYLHYIHTRRGIRYQE